MKEEIKQNWNELIKNVREYGEFPEVLCRHVEDFWFGQIDLAVSKEREKVQENIDHVLETLDNMNSAGDFKHYKTYSDLHDAVSLINTK